MRMNGWPNPGASSVTLSRTRLSLRSDRFEVRHSLTAKQIGWFKAGSALNAIAEALGART